jgi:hypothetical protein
MGVDMSEAKSAGKRVAARPPVEDTRPSDAAAEDGKVKPKPDDTWPVKDPEKPTDTWPVSEPAKAVAVKPEPEDDTWPVSEPTKAAADKPDPDDTWPVSEPTTDGEKTGK